MHAVLPNGGRIKENLLQERWGNSGIGEMPAVSLLNSLQSNYKLWIISNTSEAHIRNLKSKFSFLNHMDGIITSEMAGTHKPDHKIFLFALSKAGVDEISAIFIDDSYDNVSSATNIGIVSHHYTEFEKLIQFLSLYT